MTDNSQKGLRDASVRGVKWSAVAQIGRQAIQFMTTIILARLLAPADFGVMGMAVIATGFLTIFSDLGLSAAVIQRKDLTQRLVSSVFWFSLGASIFCGVALFAASPFLAWVYNEAGLTDVLRVLSLSLPIAGVGVTFQALLARDLKFDLISKIELSATLAGAMVGIGLAFLGYGVWSLVMQMIVMTCWTSGALWISVRWRPVFGIDFGELRSIFSFSANLVGLNIFNYFSRSAGNFLIGVFLGAEQLGYYTIAYRLMTLPTQLISSVVGRVFFPVLSKMQGDHEQLRRIYVKIVQVIAFVAFPMMIGLMVVAEPIVLVLYGEKWSPAIVLLAILAPVGLLQSIGSTVGLIYQSTGRTATWFRWGILAGSLTIVSFAIGVQWGVIGVAAAYAIITLVLQHPSLALATSIVGLPMSALYRALWKPFLCACAMAVLVKYLGWSLQDVYSERTILVVLIATGVIAYAIFAWLMKCWGPIIDALGSDKGRQE